MFNRWAICEAYWCYASDYAGDAQADEYAARLRRIGYKPPYSTAVHGISRASEEGAKEAYGRLVMHHNRRYVTWMRYARRQPGIFPVWPGYSGHTLNSLDDVLRRRGIDPNCLWVFA